MSKVIDQQWFPLKEDAEKCKARLLKAAVKKGYQIGINKGKGRYGGWIVTVEDPNA